MGYENSLPHAFSFFIYCSVAKGVDSEHYFHIICHININFTVVLAFGCNRITSVDEKTTRSNLNLIAIATDWSSKNVFIIFHIVKVQPRHTKKNEKRAVKPEAKKPK